MRKQERMLQWILHSSQAHICENCQHLAYSYYVRRSCEDHAAYMKSVFGHCSLYKRRVVQYGTCRKFSLKVADRGNEPWAELVQVETRAE